MQAESHRFADLPSSEARARYLAKAGGLQALLATDGSGQTVLNQYAQTVIENHRVVVR